MAGDRGLMVFGVELRQSPCVGYLSHPRSGRDHAASHVLREYRFPSRKPRTARLSLATTPAQPSRAPVGIRRDRGIRERRLECCAGQMTVSWAGQSRATIPPAVRNRAGSGAGRPELRSAGAVHAMRGVLPGAPTCAVERGATPANPLATTACAAVSPGARVPAAVGVQVVAGSNPVAPTK